MLKAHAVGIDLGTTYSCLSYLNEHGEPVTLANQEGELSTPSVVFFDGSEVVVGTEALRNAIIAPDRVVQNSKRHIGNPNHFWAIDGQRYNPVDIATLVLQKLISAAREKIGDFHNAVITVPALFSDIQRQATMEAGLRAGLKHVDIINEPVAAALCYVLGTEGLWFTELADEQQILVYDLGGGTFDLSLVKYEKKEVSVIASGGDLNLGGIDWNESLEKAIAGQFSKEFGQDPRTDPKSQQFLAIEVENAKRGLTVRPRAPLTCQHSGYRKTYQVEQAQFEKLTSHLLDRTADITLKLLKDNQMGWAHVDAILTTGGSSRMPMVRNCLKKLGGTTLNTSLSPDQSIAHGATYYAGMLLTNSEYAKSILSKEVNERLSQIKQRSVNARALGILVRNAEKSSRLPHYLIPANTPLPTSIKQMYGTVIPNQERVHLHIVESGISDDQPFVKLGACVINDLPPNLPEDSEIEVTISYDEQARVHVSARDVTSGKEARTEIVREDNLQAEPVSETDKAAAGKVDQTAWVSHDRAKSQPAKVTSQSTGKKRVSDKPASKSASKKKASTAGRRELEETSRPVPLCNECGEPLDVRGRCKACGVSAKPKDRVKGKTSQAPKKKKNKPATSLPPIDDNEILDLKQNQPSKKSAGKKPLQTKQRKTTKSSGKKPSVKPPPLPKSPGNTNRKDAESAGEEEFWELVD